LRGGREARGPACHRAAGHGGGAEARAGRSGRRRQHRRVRGLRAPPTGLSIRSPGGRARPLLMRQRGGPGSVSGALAATRVLWPMQQRGGWCSGDVMMQWHQARRAYLCRPQSRSLIGAAASVQAVEHAARMLQAVGASESALPAAKALLTTLAKLFAATCAPCGSRTELQVRRQGRRRPQRPGVAHRQALCCDSPSERLPATTHCAGPAGRPHTLRFESAAPERAPAVQRRRPAGGAAAVRGGAAAAPAASVA